jgi:hypothetical protein
MTTIECDYFVTGTGGIAMAFIDTLLTESQDAQVVMVDRHHRPGGHWNDAYSYVRLHQPSAWYGVPSRELSDWSRESAGFNEGMLSLSSGAEVLAHFDQAMKQRFIPSGRVSWFPKCDHFASQGRTHRFRSLMTGEEHEVRVRRKWVNATHAKTEVPSTHPPKYAVDPDVQCIPCNGLPKVVRPYSHYTVVGSGKTGMDACIWLIENGVPHERMRWIMPRDAWVMDRATVQPGPDGWRRYFENSVAQFDAISAACDIPDLFRRLEAGGALMRIDPGFEPTTYRCALLSRGEMAQLRKIGEIVRLGRVRSLEPSRIVLDKGTLTADPDTLYVDCTAGAIQPAPRVPVFQDEAINLLMVRWCQPLFSGSVIAWVEAHVANLQEQNAMCTPVPGPELPIDFLRMWLPTLANAARWHQNPDLRAWLQQCRLNGPVVVLKGVEIVPAVQDLMKLVGAKAAQAAQRIPHLLATAEAA